VLGEIDQVQKSEESASAKITLVVYDVLLSGESVTNPKTRKPPLRSHYHKMLSSVLAINGGKELDENFVFIIFNGGKEGGARQRQLARCNCSRTVLSLQRFPGKQTSTYFRDGGARGRRGTHVSG